MSITTGVLLSSRDRILFAAKALFAKNGYENTSTVAIARQAGTSESQLMKHFGSKQGLLFAILERGWSAILHRAYALSSVPVRSPQTLVDVLESLAIELERDPEMKTLLVLESRRARRYSPDVSQGSGCLQFSTLVENLLQDLKNQGALRSDLSLTAARAGLFGVVEGIVFEEVVGGRDGVQQRYAPDEARRILEAFVSGLLTEPVASPQSESHPATWTHAG